MLHFKSVCTACLIPPSPPLRPHLGQHSPAGLNGFWSPGQLRGGQGLTLQDTLPLEQTHTEQGEGFHWLSCCGKPEKQTVTHTEIQSKGGGEEEEEEEPERQWDKESCFALCGRDDFVSLSLSDRQENRVTEGGERRGKMYQTMGREEGREKQEGVCECA